MKIVLIGLFAFWVIAGLDIMMISAEEIQLDGIESGYVFHNEMSEENNKDSLDENIRIFEEYSIDVNRCETEIIGIKNDGVYDEFNEVYYHFIDDEDIYTYVNTDKSFSLYYDESVYYGLHDLDGDGTYELLATNGAIAEACQAVNVFTIKNNQIYLLGIIGGRAGSTDLEYCEGIPGIFVYEGNMGWYEFSYYTVDEFKTDIVYEHVISDRDGIITVRTEDSSLVDAFYNTRTHIRMFTRDEILLMGWEAFVDEYNSIDKQIELDIAGRKKEISWGENQFNRNSEHYNENLLYASLYLSDMVERGENEGVSALEDLGFGNVTSYDYSTVINVNRPVCFIGSKKSTIGNEDTVIVAVSIRGTNSIGDGLTDVWAVTNMNGFLDPGKKVFNNLDSYVKKFYPDYKKKDIKLLITGHSLGGACAGQVARLSEKAGYNNSNIYCYTFASPNYDIEKDDVSHYKNIFNIIHERDAVPTVPWGYKRVGTDITYGNIDFSPFEKIDVIKQHITETYMRCLCEGERLSAKRGYKYVMVLCPVDIELYDNESGKLIAKTIGDTLVYQGDGSIFIQIDGEEKYIYSVENADYDVKIIGTDEGTMEYAVIDYDAENGIYKSKNVFSDVILEKDKEFISTISGKEEEDVRLIVLDDNGRPKKEVLPDGREIKYNRFGDVLEVDIPADGNIPDGIWIGGVEDLVYTGKNLIQDFRVYDGTTMLTPKTDYIVKYRNNKNSYVIADPDNLTAIDKKKAPQILITMKGNYSGKETVYFSINQTGNIPVNPQAQSYPITGEKIKITDTSGNPALSAAYNKNGVQPAIRVMYEDTVLKEGRDYTLKFAGNTKYPATKASVTITGKGNYTSKKTVPITVLQRPFTESEGITVVASDKAEGKKAGQYATTVKVFDSEGKLLKAGTDYDAKIVYCKNGSELTKTDFPKAGDKITIQVTGKGGYTNSVIETTYSIHAQGEVKDIGKATLAIKTQAYNKGKAVTIDSQDKFDKAFIGKTKTPIKLSTDGGTTGDFMVIPGSYSKNTNNGTAKVTFVGINGYTGTKTVSYKIGVRSIKDIWYGLFKPKKYYQTNEEIIDLLKQYCVSNINDTVGDKKEIVDNYFSYQMARSSDLGNGFYAYFAEISVYRTFGTNALVLPDGTIIDGNKTPNEFGKYKDYFSFDITKTYESWEDMKNDPTYAHGGYGEDNKDDSKEDEKDKDKEDEKDKDKEDDEHDGKEDEQDDVNEEEKEKERAEKRQEALSKWVDTFRLDVQNVIEVLSANEEGTIQFKLTVADASGETTVTNTYTAQFSNDDWTEFTIPYQSGINEIFKLDDNGVRVSLDNGMQGANDGLYIKNYPLQRNFDKYLGIRATGKDGVAHVDLNSYGNVKGMLYTISNSTRLYLYIWSEGGISIDTQLCKTQFEPYYDSITDIVFEEGIKNIRVQDAFSEMEWLGNVRFPATLEYIGKNSFFMNTQLTTVTFDGTNLCEIDDRAFYGCGLISISLPTSVSDNARIGSEAFAATKLTSINISTGVKEIGESAFTQCSKLKTTIIPLTVTKIGSEAFASDYIEKIYYEGTEQQWNDGIDLSSGNEGWYPSKVVFGIKYVSGISLSRDYIEKNNESLSDKTYVTETLTVTLTPADAMNRNVMVSSSNSSLVAVSPTSVKVGDDGTVNIVLTIKKQRFAGGDNKREATITAISQDGGFKATCKVAVVTEDEDNK